LYLVPPGAHLVHGHRKPLLVATRRLSFASAGTRELKISLTRAGKRLLRHAKHLELTAKATFTSTRQRAVIATKKFALHR